MKSIMFQGTGSSVGKSVIAAAFCRIFAEDGFRVVPFKAQNMALNSYITDEGLEMGRAQAVQAEAAGIKPSVLMNPILLKPTSHRASQVIIRGRVYKNMTAAEYQRFKPELARIVKEAFTEVTRSADIAVIEGAGSPAEINLKDRDIVNMGMAKMADCPVVLIGDIDRGGVFASLAGTIMLLEEEERSRIKGVIINKFRGDIEILKPGLEKLEEIIKVPVLGVIPYFDLKIDDEDSLTERFDRMGGGGGSIKVEVIRLPYMSNFTDFNAFETQPDVDFRYVNPGEAPDNPDLLILPGSKNTIEDMKYLRESGLEREIMNAYSKGAFIFGVCGGYQMLGRGINDPYGVEGKSGYIEGMGLLDVHTTLYPDKVTLQVEAVLCRNRGLLEQLEGCRISGYEIHMGRTERSNGVYPLAYIRAGEKGIQDRPDGAVNKEANVIGTYIHGIFDNLQFTRRILNNIRMRKGLGPIESPTDSYREFKEQQYLKLARIVREAVNMESIYRILGV